MHDATALECHCSGGGRAIFEFVLSKKLAQLLSDLVHKCISLIGKDLLRKTLPPIFLYKPIQHQSFLDWMASGNREYKHRAVNICSVSYKGGPGISPPPKPLISPPPNSFLYTNFLNRIVHQLQSNAHIFLSILGL